MTCSVLDRRPAQTSTALTSPPGPGPREAAREPEALPERALWVLGVIVAAVTLALFLPSVRNGRVNWDDADTFLASPHSRGLGWANIRWILAGSVQATRLAASPVQSTLAAGGAGARQ
jgi:hypothetical protein